MSVSPTDHISIDSLTLQQISTFCQVFECGGYSVAADTLGLASPTIWEQVKALERIYNAKLFKRKGRNIEPTAAGEALYQMLRPLLASVASTFDRLQEQSRDAASNIRLVTGVRMMLEELGAPLRQFQKLFPTARMQLMTADNATAQELVLAGKADIALLIEPPPDVIAEGIDYETLYPIEYLVALPRRHRLARQRHVSLNHLAGEPLIVGSPHTIGRILFEQARFRIGMKQPLNIVAETDNSAITIACVRAGMGVGIIAGRPDGQLTRRVETRSISKEIGRVNVVAAYRKGRQFTRAVQSLVELMQIDP